jgi:hypothetical protein
MAYEISDGIHASGTQLVDAKLYVGVDQVYASVSALISTNDTNLVDRMIVHDTYECRDYQIRTNSMSAPYSFYSLVVPAINFTIDSVITTEISNFGTSPSPAVCNMSSIAYNHIFLLTAQTTKNQNGVYVYDSRGLTRHPGFTDTVAATSYKKHVNCSFVVNNSNSDYNGTRWYFVDDADRTNSGGTLSSSGLTSTGDDILFAREIHYDCSAGTTVKLVTQNALVVGEQAENSTSITLKDLSAGNTAITGTLSTSGLATLNSVSVTGNETVGGTLGVTGATTLSSTLGVTGATTLSSTLGVTGATTLGAVTATGATTLNGNTNICTGSTGSPSIGRTGAETTITGSTIDMNGLTYFDGYTKSKVETYSADGSTTNLDIRNGNIKVVTLAASLSTTVDMLATGLDAGITFIFVFKTSSGSASLRFSPKFINLTGITDPFTVTTSPIILSGVIIDASTIYATLSVAGQSTI